MKVQQKMLNNFEGKKEKEKKNELHTTSSNHAYDNLRANDDI